MFTSRTFFSFHHHQVDTSLLTDFPFLLFLNQFSTNQEHPLRISCTLLNLSFRTKDLEMFNMCDIWTLTFKPWHLGFSLIRAVVIQKAALEPASAPFERQQTWEQKEQRLRIWNMQQQKCICLCLGFRDVSFIEKLDWLWLLTALFLSFPSLLQPPPPTALSPCREARRCRANP